MHMVHGTCMTISLHAVELNMNMCAFNHKYSKPHVRSFSSHSTTVHAPILICVPTKLRDVNGFGIAVRACISG